MPDACNNVVCHLNRCHECLIGLGSCVLHHDSASAAFPDITYITKINPSTCIIFFLINKLKRLDAIYEVPIDFGIARIDSYYTYLADVMNHIIGKVDSARPCDGYS